jgi:hypothetical protein
MPNCGPKNPGVPRGYSKVFANLHSFAVSHASPTTASFVLSFSAVTFGISKIRRSQWARGLRRGSATERLLGSWVQIPLGAWTFVLYSVCVVR